MIKIRLLIVLLCLSAAAWAQVPAEHYAVDSASVVHAGVPKGEVLKFTFENSRIFPGTWREYWVYIPAQYKADKPACVYIDQDNVQFKAPVVFDNLINSKEIPVTIGVFVSPGRVRATDANTALDRFNRSFEYDGLGDAYARFILNEILPEVEKQHATDGRPIKLSKNGNDRAIAGSSSGAIAAFTAAWEHPEEFSRVFSAIGTYVGIRGGDRYPTLIRKYEPKPLRIFLQDGSNDQNSYAGDWFFENQMMERALTFAGYEVNHAWGEGAHNGNQATAILPQVMRWLWQDYPKPVTAGQSKNYALHDILIPGEGWELVGDGYGFTEGIIADKTGNVFFQDIPNSKTYTISARGKPVALKLDAKGASGTAFGPDGKRYAVARTEKQVVNYDEHGKVTVLANDINGNDLIIAKNGNIYVTEANGSEKPGKVYLITPGGKKTVVDEGLKYPNGLALTPDQTQLYVAESSSHWIWVYSIKPDGTLTNKQKYGWLHVPDTEENAWPDGLKCDRNGMVYVATRLGIQVMDQIGKVAAILPLPGNVQPSNLCFGGVDFDTLYVTCGTKVYKRKLHTHGANTFDEPNKPVAPKL
jgi:sugar lactone lactonase YvrE/enterochelin esterase-like enzyme